MFDNFSIQEIREWLYEVDCELNDLLHKKSSINIYERVQIRVTLENMIAACRYVEEKINELPF